MIYGREKAKVPVTVLTTPVIPSINGNTITQNMMIKIEQTTASETTCFGSVTYTYEKCFIEIVTLEELIELSKMCGTEIIIDGNELEIYDGYRE